LLILLVALVAGIYSIKGRDRAFNFNLLVRVRNRAAPCQGP
jgi:hypothetical protein